MKIYNEPADIDYIICKVKQNRVNKHGYYDATREGWVLKLEKAKNYKYVLAVVKGIVKEVFEVESWEQSTSKRIEFNGKIAQENIRKFFIGKKIPEKYRKRGCANPVQYKK